MDKQLQKLYQLFNETIERLRHSSLASNETMDVLLFLLLWKHQSDTGIFKGKMSLSNVPYDIPDSEVVAISKNTVDKLNSKYSKSTWDVISIKLADLQSTLPGIIHTWKNASDVNLALWNNSAIKDIFIWINDYLGNNLYSASEFFTPESVAVLLSKCIQDKKASEIYDPFCRSGNLLEAMVATQTNSKAFGVTQSATSYRLARVQEIILNSGITISTEYFSVGKNYDVVVTNPPFNVPDYRNLPVNGEWSRNFSGSKSDIAFLAHSIDSLSENATCAVIMPTQFLSGGGVNKRVRQDLIHQNILEGIVTLPAGLFFGTSIPAVIVFIATGRTINVVKMVDASDFGKKDKSRKLLLTSEEINSLATLYKGNKTNATNSIIVPVAEIISRDYDLRFNTFQKKPSVIARRPSKEIFGEILGLEEKLKDLQKKYREIVLNETHNL